MLGPDNRPALGIVRPALLPPYEGALDEILREYETNPKSFKTALLQRMASDNRDLAHMLERNTYPNPEIAFKFAGIYYELYARSSKKAGLPTLRVSTQVFIQHGIEAISTPDPLEDPDEALDKYLTETKARRVKDEIFSTELMKFWLMTDKYLHTPQDKIGKDHALSNLMLVFDMQALFQKQEEVFSKTRKTLS